MRKIIATLLAALLLLSMGTALAEAGMPNPWTETTKEGLMDALGLTLGVPEGATNVQWRMLEEAQMGELLFTWYDLDYTARVVPADGFEDISGIYIDWEQRADCTVGRCAGVCYRGHSGENDIDLCLWYDELTGLMYSVSTQFYDLNGFDILAAAEQVFVPMQTE